MSKAWRISLLVLLCVAFVAFFACDDAYADSNAGADRSSATKQGVSESLGSKEWDEDQMPGAPQIGLAIGSVVAMIAVIKFL